MRMYLVLIMTALLAVLLGCQPTPPPISGGTTSNPNIEFLAANKAKQGVKVTRTGLQYRVVKKGAGKSPKSTDHVTVHYKGTLINGEVFDSSYKRGQPATFALNQVIPGWTEGVQLMQEGDTFEFVIPSSLAYGTRGAGSNIPPGATLVFIVELIKVL